MSTEVDIDTWLNDWEAWLDMLISCGTDTPSDAVHLAISDWQQNIPAQGFETLQEVLFLLLNPNSSRAERAQALLDLSLWHRTMSRLYQQAQLSFD